MLSHIQHTYANLDAALTTLTESIAAYTPSPSAASDLLAADAALNASLTRLHTHQRNVRRAVQLRATADALDEQLQSALKLLAATRREAAEIPCGVEVGGEGEGQKRVGVSELLEYAAFVGKTTVPPGFRGRLEEGAAAEGEGAGGEEGGKEVGANGVAATPGGDVKAETATPAPPFTEPPKMHEVPVTTSTKATQDLPPEASDWFDPLRQAAREGFEPWPTWLNMSHGALGTIQRMLDQGMDPRSVLTPEERVEAERRRAEEEEREARAREEAERRRASLFDTGNVGRGRGVDVFDPDA